MKRVDRGTSFGPTRRVHRICSQLLGRAVRLGAIGLVAAGLGALGGTSFVSGDPPGVTYTPARCADFLEYAPKSRTCEQAATAHHFTEVVGYRIAAGVVGAAILGAIALIRRRRPRLFDTDRLPVAFDETIAATLFGVAGVWLLGFGIDQLALAHDGAGFFLSGGIVAALAAAWYAAGFLRRTASSLA